MVPTSKSLPLKPALISIVSITLPAGDSSEPKTCRFHIPDKSLYSRACIHEHYVRTCITDALAIKRRFPKHFPLLVQRPCLLYVVAQRNGSSVHAHFSICRICVQICDEASGSVCQRFARETSRRQDNSSLFLDVTVSITCSRGDTSFRFRQRVSGGEGCRMRVGSLPLQRKDTLKQHRK